MSYNEAPEEYQRFEDLDGNYRWRGPLYELRVGNVAMLDRYAPPWNCARQDYSVFPDVDQMLADIGPSLDARFADKVLAIVREMKKFDALRQFR